MGLLCIWGKGDYYVQRSSQAIEREYDDSVEELKAGIVCLKSVNEDLQAKNEELTKKCRLKETNESLKENADTFLKTENKRFKSHIQ